MSTAHISTRTRCRAEPRWPTRTPARTPGRKGPSCVEQLQDTAQRDVQPVRTIIELVYDFVECLLQKISVEQHARLLVIGGNVRAACTCREVRIQERGADPAMPESRARLQCDPIFRSQ